MELTFNSIEIYMLGILYVLIFLFGIIIGKFIGLEDSHKA